MTRSFVFVRPGPDGKIEIPEGLRGRVFVTPGGGVLKGADGPAKIQRFEMRIDGKDLGEQIRKQVEEADDPAAKKAELIEAYCGLIDVYVAARNDMIDDVIDPLETRPTVIRALELAEGKRVERPWKRHGVVPV